MNASDIKIGLRVNVRSNGLNALVVGNPEYYTPKAKLVQIKYENSTRYEYMIHHQLDMLPVESQYPAHGGNYVKPEGSF
jgi:hypothetical protein|tara:strand:+ start:1414 stop:1650 length:237 start_codon:yes stop_codon:yes gene_type:complete